MAKTSIKQGKVLVVENKDRQLMENPRYAAVRLELSEETVAALEELKASQPGRAWTFSIPNNGEVCALPTIDALAVMLQRAKDQPEDILIPTWFRNMLD